MSRHTHPRSLSEHSRHVLDTLTDAYTAALDLAQRGHELIGIRIGERYPCVEVAAGPRCRQLLSGTKVRRSRAGRIETTYAARHKGVQVEWTEVSEGRAVA